MPQTKTYHVVPSERGWTVVERGSRTNRGSTNGRTNGSLTGEFARKQDAEFRAKELAREAGGGDVVIHSKAGRITDTDTVGVG